LADLVNDIDELRKELKQATNEICLLLAKFIFNAACAGAVIAIGVLTGDPSNFISLFGPIKGGVENARDARLVWKRRKEVKSKLKGKIHTNPTHDSTPSQASSLVSFGSKVGIMADIWSSLANDVDKLLSSLQMSSAKDVLMTFESSVTVTASLYDQLAVAFYQYSSGLSVPV